MAAAYGQLGDKANAEAALGKVLKIEPTYGSRVADDLAKRGVSQHIIVAIVDGLVKAGLQVPPQTSD
jgi:hypothetical protein